MYPVDSMLPSSFDSRKVDCYKYHGLGHNNLLPFFPCGVAWKNYDVGCLDYGVLQTHNWKSKWVVDKGTHMVDSFVHSAVHTNVHEKIHKVFHEMIQKQVHDMLTQQEVLSSEIQPF